MTFKRLLLLDEIKSRLGDKRRFMQVLAGPRQVGKTTLIHQVLEETKLSHHYASADEPGGKDPIWIEQQWEVALRSGTDLLVLDEVHKVSQWSEAVKKFWDRDTRTGAALKVVLLGSSPLLVKSGLGESLAGRFELIRVPHWSFPEMRTAFGFDLDSFVYFGGYPGAAELVSDEGRWFRYINDSLVETSISRDVLLMTRIDKPALLRQLFLLACASSGRIMSYQKMIGHLQDAGNTTTLAHYLELLGGAGLVGGLEKFSPAARRRGSSPKLQALNNALLSVAADAGFSATRDDPQAWGHWVESAVGAHLLNSAPSHGIEVSYWREGQKEVDFVLRKGKVVVAIEVKSGRRRDSLPGLREFSARFKPKSVLLVGADGIAVADFLSRSPKDWM